MPESEVGRHEAGTRGAKRVQSRTADKIIGYKKFDGAAVRYGKIAKISSPDLRLRILTQCINHPVVIPKLHKMTASS